jgi:hypothetical protein
VAVTYYQCSSSHGNAKVAEEAGLRAPCPAPAHVRADLLDDAVWAAVLAVEPVAPEPGDEQRATRERERERATLLREQKRLLRDLRAGEAQVLHLTGHRRAAAEANNEAWATRLSEVERELDALAAAQRVAGRERDRTLAVMDALLAHHDRLLALRPWTADRADDAAMQGLVRALDVRAVVDRPKGLSKTQPVTWTLTIGGQEIRVGTAPHLRLDAAVSLAAQVTQALAAFRSGAEG